MNIGILTNFKEKNRTGIDRVTAETVKQLIKIDRENKYSLIGDISWSDLDLPRVDVIDSNAEITNLNFMLMSKKYHIIHSFYKAFQFNDFIKCGKILTVHDIMPLIHPEWYARLTYNYFNECIRKAVTDADIIIAMSEYTKKDIVEHYHVNDRKIHVIYSGLPSDFYENNKMVEVKIDAPYILSVSALRKNKNQLGLIEAFERFKESNPDNNIKLVFTGPERSAEMISGRIKDTFIEKNVVFTGFVSDSQLKYLYKNAIAFAYVSLYEGFGLPILEAMSLGKAVICSNVTSMPEVGSNAVEYCNPYDVDSIKNAIENIVFRDDRRNELEKKAIIQAAKFSYRKAAEQTLEIYKTFE